MSRCPLPPWLVCDYASCASCKSPTPDPAEVPAQVPAERTCERHDLSWTAPVDACPKCQDETTPPTDHAAAPTSERGA